MPSGRLSRGNLGVDGLCSLMGQGELSAPGLGRADEHKSYTSYAEASAGEDIVELVRGIENLTKDDAIARLLELEEFHEKTFFEIGGVLSAIQKRKWFDPFSSLDAARRGLKPDLRLRRYVWRQVGRHKAP
jgi:hypothetical protein